MNESSDPPVPVTLARWRPNRVARADHAHRTTLGLDEASTGEHDQYLSVLVLMPVGARARSEIDGVDDHAVGGGHRQVRKDVSRELRSLLARGYLRVNAAE